MDVVEMVCYVGIKYVLICIFFDINVNLGSDSWKILTSLHISIEISLAIPIDQLKQ